MSDSSLSPPLPRATIRPGARFLLAHPAHLIALGFGTGLARRAPGTFGTLGAWLAFHLIAPRLGPAAWAGLLLLSLVGGWWACSVTARHLGVADPGAIVWDEVLAFWLVLSLVAPAAGLWGEAAAFAWFRFFDAAKPGPVGWADARFKGRPGSLPGWREGWGILFDDLVAALCTLLVIALWRFV